MRNFKRILKTVSLFLAVIIVLSVVFGALYLRGENYDYQDYRERDALAGELTMLINGASYVMYGIDPDVLDAYLGANVRSYNLTTSMLTLEGRYALLKKELERNPVKTVILEVSPDTVTRDRSAEVPEGDLHMLGKFGTASERFQYFKDNFYLSEYPLAYYDVVSKGMESAIALLTGRYQKVNTVARKGFYYTLNEKRPIPTDYRAVRYVHRFPDEIPEENVKGLERLLDLCREHGALPILISVPNSKAYNIMYANLDDYDRWFQDFAASHNVVYVNFNRHKEKLNLLPDETCFYDETHLNMEGAAIFTEMLGSIISNIWYGQNYDWQFFKTIREIEYSPGFYD